MPVSIHHLGRLLGPARLGAAMAAAVLLASCQTVPSNTAVPIPPAFRNGRAVAAAPAPQTWTRGFGAPELERLVASALAQNLDVEAAAARFDQAEANAVIAEAPLLPSLTGSGDAQRSQSSGNRSGSGSFTPTRANSFSLGGTASYQLDLFGRNRFAARAARLDADAARFDRDTTALSTVASVANTYFAVVSTQDRLRIAEENLRVAGRVLDAIRGRLGVGTATALDLAQQESVVATQRAAIPPLRQALAQNRYALALLVGRTPESVSVAGGSLDRMRLPAVAAGLPSQLLLRRPDIAAAEANLAAAEASVAAARAAFFPSIQLSAGGGVQSAALRTLLGANSVFYSLAAGLTQPIFDGLSLQGQLALQQGRTAEAAATYRKAIIQSFVDVESALVAVRETAEYEARQREAVAASRRALDVTEQRLREGTVDVVTLFTIQTTLFGNQDALARVRLLRFQAAVQLFSALGGGWTAAGAAPLNPAPAADPASRRTLPTTERASLRPGPSGRATRPPAPAAPPAFDFGLRP